MKPYSLLAAAIALLWPLISAAEADGALKLETGIYVFKNSDVHEVFIPGATLAADSQGAVFKLPATTRFDQVTLALDGLRITWSGNNTPPAQFSLVAAPTVAITVNQPTALLFSVPTQYLERRADGSLQVYEIPANSPDAAHCQLTLNVGATTTATEVFRLTCDLDVATIQARENLPGVSLDVGKPVMAHFKQALKFMAGADQWSALLVQSPNGSDYSMLVLLKVGPPSPAGKQLSKVAEYHLKTPRFGAAAVAGGDFVYAIGGQNRGGILGDIERFDIHTHQVTRLTNDLIPRHHHGAALVDGKIYIYGGQSYELPQGSPFEATTEIYDLASGKITRGAPMPVPHGNFATAALGGKIYVLGGVYGDHRVMTQTNRVAIYDLATDTWADGTPMPTPRDASSAAVVNGCIIVTGGHRRPTIASGTKAVESFDPGKDEWSVLPELGRPLSAHSTAMLGNCIFMFGSYDPSDEILAYDLTTHSSAVFKDGFIPASQPAAVALDGLIYVIGGTGGGGRQWSHHEAMDEIQVFALAAGTSH